MTTYICVYGDQHAVVSILFQASMMPSVPYRCFLVLVKVQRCYSTAGFFKENVRYPVSLILGTQFFLILGTR